MKGQYMPRPEDFFPHTPRGFAKTDAPATAGGRDENIKTWLAERKLSTPPWTVTR